MLMPVTEMLPGVLQPPASSLAGTTARGAVGSGVGDTARLQQRAAVVPFASPSGHLGTGRR